MSISTPSPPQNTISDQHTSQKLQEFVKANPLDEIALTSSILGIILGASVALLPFLIFKSIALYTITLCIFHFLEFYITARYNSSKVNKDSFLINNGYTYLAAHMFSIVEAYIEFYFFPQFKSSFLSTKALGFCMIVMGQILRSFAMITAGESFSHMISVHKKNDHVLIKNGVYSHCRHPSYAGFFYWALGTQLILLNPVCLLGFLIVLWRFFSQRIKYEEQYLMAFFGKDYEVYRSTTKTWIPFI